MTTSNIIDQDIELEKAPLYEIYEQANLNDEEVESDLKALNILNKSKLSIDDEEEEEGEEESDKDNARIISSKSQTLGFVTILKNFFILGNLGVLFNKLGGQIHDNHILYKNLASKPLQISAQLINFLNIPEYYIFAIQGIVFGSLLPLLDYTVFSRYANSKMKSKKLKEIKSTSSIIRSLAAFLGVAFAFRKIEWTSSIQASFAWTLLNPCLWLLLDGSFSGLATSLISAIVAVLISVAFDVEPLPTDWFQDTELLAVNLWLANFFFFGLLIFGKIGRSLYNQ
ncbi:hypothetical protein WICPIJ_005867 [Wickerhamomyces pijperi]|uniref:Uncharacterized protein n=1 Tax=Wickerhamomyces pijperi TaxID=599730 RepID=A0A9P8Q543_WICPI|nr:hypothetical protein WICPIJ_005867 [Wickerhamomyces pijperi]